MQSLSLLPRYENKYLNCYHSELISYLHNLNYPVELLFYQTLESTKKIYAHYLINNGKKWNYPSAILSPGALQMLNISAICRNSSYFLDAEHEIRRLLSAGYPVFLSSDLYYLPHKTEQHRKESIPHTVLLTGFSGDGERANYYLLDDNFKHASDFTSYCYDRSVIELGFDSPVSDRTFTYLRLDPWTRNAVIEDVSQAFIQWLELHDDDFRYYDFLSDLLTKLSPSLDFETIEKLSASLALISASRKIFARYITAIDGPNFVIGFLEEASRLSEIIKHQLRRFTFVHEIDTSTLLVRCDELKHLEQSVVDALRNHYLN